MIFTVALVDLDACRRTLGRDGVRRLLEAGVRGLDLRLPSTTRGADWEALVDLACWTWELGGTVTVHSWEGRFDGDRATTDRAEGRKDALHVVERIKALQTQAISRWYGLKADLKAVDIATRWRDQQREAGNKRWMAPSLHDVLTKVATVEVYRANFERDVWRGKSAGGDRRFANPHADEYIDEFFTTFYRELTTCFADYLGFGNPDGHYVNSDLDGDGHQDDTIPADLYQRVRRAALMVYQSTEADMRSVIAKNRTPWHELDLAIYVGVGRIDAKQGQVGSLKALGAILRSPPTGLVEVVHYVGYGAEGQLLDGHPGYPAIVHAVPALREVALAAPLPKGVS